MRRSSTNCGAEVSVIGIHTYDLFDSLNEAANSGIISTLSITPAIAFTSTTTTIGFRSRDPIGFKGSEWNMYEYGDSKALIGLDPLGKETHNPFEKCCHGKSYYSLIQCCGDDKKVHRKRTNKECCDGYASTGAADGVAGTNICCDGTNYTCVFIANPPTDKADRLIRRCVQKHENQHWWNHAAPCPKTCGKSASDAPWKNPQERIENECSAYLLEHQCLEYADSRCGEDPTCLEKVKNRRERVKELYEETYNCGPIS